MRIFLTDQGPHFQRHLAALKGKSVMAYRSEDLREKASSVRIATSTRLIDLDLHCLFSYRIFPPHIMAHYGEWEQAQRSMQAGDTLVQQIFLPPTRFFSQKIIVGVRIKELIDLPEKRGFSYETLDGHVEKGISTFTVEYGPSGEILFKIHTFSKPANLLARMMGPIFSLPYQRYCTQSALDHVKAQMET